MNEYKDKRFMCIDLADRKFYIHKRRIGVIFRQLLIKFWCYILLTPDRVSGTVCFDTYLIGIFAVFVVKINSLIFRSVFLVPFLT